jgi:CRISPR-associated endonuclease Cas1
VGAALGKSGSPEEVREMSPDDTLYGRIKNGVLTLSGNNPSVKVTNGNLIVSDGPEAVPTDHRGPAPPVEDRMAKVSLPRASCPVNRIVVTRPDGFITFAAIKWLHDAGVSLTQLDWDGTVLLAAAPTGPDRPATRRAQALAAGDATGLAIMREILRCKLTGQARMARLLGSEDTAALIDRLAGEINETQRGTHILGIEGAAAAAYWALWRDIPVHFARRDKVPEHWQTFGFRRPEGSGYPHKATTVGGALLNYLYGVLAGEMKLALHGVGLDPGIGVFHADKQSRASLAYDAMEAARPYAEAWLLSCLAQSRFSKRDFHEEGDGAVRITRPLTSYLAMTAPLWRSAAEVVAGWLAESFAGFARRLDARGLDDDVISAASVAARVNMQKTADSVAARLQLSTPLPSPLPSLPSPGRTYGSVLAHDVMPRACYECGHALVPTQRKFCSASCSDRYRAEIRRFVPIAPGGTLSPAIRDIHRSEEARSAKLRRVSAERRAWENAHKSVGAGDGRWAEMAVRAQLHRWYAAQIQPRISDLHPKDIVGAIEVSRAYARQLIAGQIPHRRHFPALAKLVGVAVPKALRVPGKAAAASQPQSVPDGASETELVN